MLTELDINYHNVLEPARSKVREQSYSTDGQGGYRILRHVNIARKAVCIFTKVFAFTSS